jgi:hypothetical protein
MLEIGHDLDLAENSLVITVEYSPQRSKSSERKAFTVMK